MKVLVTGVSGYIGGQTAIQLKDQGHEVYGLDIRSFPDHLINLEILSEFAQDNFASNDALTWIANHNFDAINREVGEKLNSSAFNYTNILSILQGNAGRNAKGTHRQCGCHFGASA